MPTDRGERPIEELKSEVRLKANALAEAHRTAGDDDMKIKEAFDALEFALIELGRQHGEEAEEKMRKEIQPQLNEMGK